MNLPENIPLPFFAYGLFKPGELCYIRIKNLVQATSEAEVDGSLKESDGVPILVTTGHRQIKGALIHFQAGREEEAYKKINKIEPDKIYKWQEVRTTEGPANVLIGKGSDRRFKDIEDIDVWSGKSDPFFNDALEEIETILKENSDFNKCYKKLFRLQMAYTLLWSAIERYAGLRYSLRKGEQNIEKIADEPAFTRGLEKYVKESRSIHSAINPKKDNHTLDPNNALESFRYYRQIRHNVVHRGKASYPDFNKLRDSLEELLAIFNEVLDEAWATSK